MNKRNLDIFNSKGEDIFRFPPSPPDSIQKLKSYDRTLLLTMDVTTSFLTPM